MFSSGMEECKSGKVELPDVTSLTMDLILNAIYRQVLLLIEQVYPPILWRLCPYIGLRINVPDLFCDPVIINVTKFKE